MLEVIEKQCLHFIVCPPESTDKFIFQLQNFPLRKKSLFFVFMSKTDYLTFLFNSHISIYGLKNPGSAGP